MTDSSASSGSLGRRLCTGSGREVGGNCPVGGGGLTRPLEGGCTLLPEAKARFGALKSLEIKPEGESALEEPIKGEMP